MRMIDAAAFERHLMSETSVEDICDDCLQYVTDELMNYPTVDAAPVIRCKDCKWYQEGKLLTENRFCFRLKHPKEDRRVGYNFGPEDFCSYGEREDADAAD